MKRLLSALMMLLFLLGIAVAAQAADVNYKGELSGLVGTKNYIEGNYKLPGNFIIEGAYKDNAPRAGVAYQNSDVFGIKAGARYDLNQKNSLVYGGLNFLVPFGSIKFFGSYDYNIKGDNWASYETSFRIQMYENLFIYAGIRGDSVAGVPVNDYNPLFIKADFTNQWTKAELNVQALLYIQGTLVNNYSFKYNLNDRVALLVNAELLVNINDKYDSELKYGLGMQLKF